MYKYSMYKFSLKVSNFMVGIFPDILWKLKLIFYWTKKQCSCSISATPDASLFQITHQLQVFGILGMIIKFLGGTSPCRYAVQYPEDASRLPKGRLMGLISKI